MSAIDANFITALAALVTAIATLVWSVRRDNGAE